MPVSVHLYKIGEQLTHVVQCVGALRVASDFRDLPRIQVTVDVFGELLALFGELLDLLRDVNRRLTLHITQLFDFQFQFGNGLLEIKKSFFSQNSFSKCLHSECQCSIVPQYSTGTGSNDLQIYQVATLQYGAQA